MSLPNKEPEGSKEDGRHDERLSSHDRAILILEGGDRINGLLENMSSGGMFFQPEGKCPTVNPGEHVEVELNLYGRKSKFSCEVTRWEALGLGLKLLRDDG